ncbi:unnamed protein product [Parnassius apollo]|uniref:(apollo) hypothetical protein n=1 Tax=Parnassius apollo TaxID=110799 RepID=A0A8S3X841_PARAO|nr:unnamed protein product [Parnassius apollo]
MSVLEALQLAKALARSPRVRQGRDRATPSTTSPRTPCASRTSGSVECVGGAAAGGSAGAQSAGAAGPRPRHAQAPRARGHPAPHTRAGQLSVLPALQLAKRCAQPARAAGPRPCHAQAPRARGHPAPHARAGQLSVLVALQLAEALERSPRVREGRDRATSKQHEPEDTLRLTHERVS